MLLQLLSEPQTKPMLKGIQPAVSLQCPDSPPATPPQIPSQAHQDLSHSLSLTSSSWNCWASQPHRHPTRPDLHQMFQARRVHTLHLCCLVVLLPQLGQFQALAEAGVRVALGAGAATVSHHRWGCQQLQQQASPLISLWLPFPPWVINHPEVLHGALGLRHRAPLHSPRPMS